MVLWLISAHLPMLYVAFACLLSYKQMKSYCIVCLGRGIPWLINNLEKTDPSEIKRTYNIRKQQTRFYWVCSWELMESAIILTPPSTGLSGILLSVRTQYSWRTRIWKNINTISSDRMCSFYSYRCTWYTDADPESFVRGAGCSKIKIFFLLLQSSYFTEGRAVPYQYSKWATIGLPATCHLNGV